MNPPTTHPSNGDLTAFASRRLTVAQMRAIDAHLEGCSQCYQFVQAIRQRQQVISTPGPAALGTDSAPARRSAPPLLLDEVPEFLRDHPRYQIVRKLGAGGMGLVFQARHKVMDREVAIKLMAAKYHDQQQAIDRFYREIKTVARLDHPNICRAFDAEQGDDCQMLVMEYVDGKDLEKIVRKKGPLPIAHACHYVRQACRGLQHAHEQGMIHRDIKPSNLMLTKTGYIKVLDFGLARFVSEQQQFNGQLTQQDGPMGTPCYLSPEQAMRPAEADIRSDLYSLGCTLYHFLAGRPPFTGDTKFEVLTAHQSEPPPRIHRFRPDVPEELWRVLQRLLAKNPNERPQTPDELADRMAPFAKSGSRIVDGGAKGGRARESIPMLEIVSDPEDLLEAEIVTDQGSTLSRFPRATPHEVPPPLPVLEPIPESPRQRSSRARFVLDDDRPSRPRSDRRRGNEPHPTPRTGLASRLLAILLALLFLGGLGAIAWYAGWLAPLFDKPQPVREGVARAKPDSLSYSAGTYTVRFPGKEQPRFETDSLTAQKLSPRETVSVVTTSTTSTRLILSVGESTLTPAMVRMADRKQLIESLIRNSSIPGDGKPEPLAGKLDGVPPGAEWSGTMPGSAKQPVYFRARLFVADDRAYRLVVKSPDREQLKSPVVNEFFDSFALVASVKKKS